MCCRPGVVPAQLAALWARDSARRDIGGWGRGRRGGAKATLVMIQLAWPRSLQPLLGIVAGLFDSCRALWSVWCLQPGPVGGFAALGAVLRRVVGVSWLYWCNSPRGRRCRGYGWRPGRRPRAARPRARRAQPPPMPPSRLGPPTHAPRPRLAPALDLPRDVGRPPRPSQAPRAARPAQLSASFQAFARNDSQPLHLGALICQRPLDTGVRHAQTPPLDCDAQYNSHG